MKILLCFFLILNITSLITSKVRNENDNSGIDEPKLILKKIPLFINKNENILFEINFNVNSDKKNLKRIILHFTDESNLSSVTEVSASILTDGKKVFGKSGTLSKSIEINGNYIFKNGINTIQFNFYSNQTASLVATFSLKEIKIQFKDEKPVKVHPDEDYNYRTAVTLRSQGQDNCDTYRIPGLITAGNGVLVAVYDVRYNNSKDLQENIDIGMSRSINGGQNWETMKIIMDMGEWGGRPEKLNGIGDPCILYDPATNTI